MRRVLLGISLALVTGSCVGGESGTLGGTTGSVRGEGVVHRGVGPECPDQWHIATSGGQMYWPVEDPAFQEEGLRVRFEVRGRPDLMSTCQAGTMVDVVSIEKL